MYKGRVESNVQELLRKKQWDRAFEKILDLYEAKVIRLVTGLVGNTGRAEEVAQDALFKVWQALELYDGRAALGTWIYTIARNTALTHVRSELYRRTVPLDSIAEPVAAATGDFSDEIRGMVDRLPEEQREVVVLYYYQEKSVEEVARMLDLPEGTVKSHLYRARKALAGMMKGAHAR